MADEQPPAPVVVLPADVHEAPPPPAVAVAEENPTDTAVVTPHPEVNFSPLICCLFDLAISHASIAFPSPFLAVFAPWPMRFYLTRSLVAECLFPVLLCFLALFLLLGCGRVRNSFCWLGPRREKFLSVLARMGIIFVGCARVGIHCCRLWPRMKRLPWPRGFSRNAPFRPCMNLCLNVLSWAGIIFFVRILHHSAYHVRFCVLRFGLFSLFIDSFAVVFRWQCFDF